MEDLSARLRQAETSASLPYSTESTSNGNFITIKEERLLDNDNFRSSVEIGKHSPSFDISQPSTSKCEPPDSSNAFFEPIVSFEESDRPLDIPHCSSSSGPSTLVDMEEGHHDENFINIKEEPSSDGEANEINPLDEAECAVPWEDSHHLLGGPSTAADYEIIDDQSEPKDPLAGLADDALPTKLSSEDKNVAEGNICLTTGFLNPKDVEEHEKEQNSLMYRCSYCDRKFRNIAKLQHHTRTHTKNTIKLSFKCNKCKKKFTSQCSFKAHMKNYHDIDAPYKCDICKESGFRTEAKLRRHLMSHSDFNCAKCNADFLTKKELDDHEYNNHNPLTKYYEAPCIQSTSEPKSFKCRICAKGFPRLKDAETHEMTHSSVITYSCNYCSRRFLSPSKLQIHEQAHNDNHSYECYICKKEFGSAGSLKMHMQNHHNCEYAFKCPLCTESSVFKTENKLYKHIKTHSGFNCSKCNADFFTKKELREHEYDIHTFV